MAISVNANTLTNNNTFLGSKTKTATNYVANYAEKKQSVNLSSGSKRVTQIMEGSEYDKLEDNRLLHKMQLSKTRLDAMGEYFGAMETAKRESGMNGFLMFRRVTNLVGTQKDYEKSENYKNKKLTDTFISDQVDALRELQEELLEEQARKLEQKEQEAGQNENMQSTENNKGDMNSEEKGKTTAMSVTSAAQAEQKQQAGVKVYQNSFANQKKSQKAVNFSGMI